MPLTVAPVFIVILCLLSGCTSWFTAKTTAVYRILPDGTKEISYSSDKEQQGLKVIVNEDPKTKSVDIAVDKSVTPEQAIAAALKVQSDLLMQLLPLIQKGAMAGS